jgi:hypothetical protein
MADSLEDEYEAERAVYREAGGVLVSKADEEFETWDFGEDDGESGEESLAFPPIPSFASAHAGLVGKGKGQVKLLYQAAYRVMRHLDAGPQRWRDCVSWGVSGAIDLRACVEVEEQKAEHYGWEERVCTEALQALAAHEYNSGRGTTNSRLGVIAAREGGTISRKILGAYSGPRAKAWAASGLPDRYEPQAKRHRVRDVSHVRSFADARDAIYAGLPVVIGCSKLGFRNHGSGIQKASRRHRRSLDGSIA